MLLGIGQVPVTLLIGVFLLCWGAFGLLANQLFGILQYPGIYIWPSLAVTFVVSSVVTRSMAAVVGRLLPGEETYGVTRFELVGSLGKVIYPATDNSGTVDIKDRTGTVHRVQAKVEPGTDPVPAGSDVIIVDFDEDDKRFVVRQGSI
jgi:membrane protein implicated in regulation of membrane protease activity